MYTNTRLGAYLHPVKLASVSIENISISEKTKNKSSSICEAVLWFHTKFEVPNQSHLGDAKNDKSRAHMHTSSQICASIYCHVCISQMGLSLDLKFRMKS